MPKRGDIPAKSWRMEISRLTAELPGKEVSFHYVPFIQRACTGHPRPKAVAFCCRGKKKKKAPPG